MLKMYTNARFHSYTNARFQSIGTTSDFGTKFDQNHMNYQTFEKENIKIIISL